VKRLALVLLFVAGCAGAFTSARNVLDSLATSARTQEALLTQACAAAVDASRDEAEVAAVLAECDAAYDLYVVAKADFDALKSELEKPEPDAWLVGQLTLNAERSAEAFARAVAALL
jgi:hypothetical protein